MATQEVKTSGHAHGRRLLARLGLVLLLSGTFNGPARGAVGTKVEVQPRVVVLEAFMRPTCGICQASSSHIDDLARQYAGKPVVAIEHSADTPKGERVHRWWAAKITEESVTLPLILVNSGHQISNGHVAFDAVYRQMIDAELARPAGATIAASATREGNHLEVPVKLANSSGLTLGPANKAALHAIVYEDARAGLTARYARSVADFRLTAPLLPGDSLSKTLATPDITDVDWSKLHVVVLADFQPRGARSPYDALQATVVDVM